MGSIYPRMLCQMSPGWEPRVQVLTFCNTPFHGESSFRAGFGEEKKELCSERSDGKATLEGDRQRVEPEGTDESCVLTP